MYKITLKWIAIVVLYTSIIAFLWCYYKVPRTRYANIVDTVPGIQSVIFDGNLIHISIEKGTIPFIKVSSILVCRSQSTCNGIGYSIESNEKCIDLDVGKYYVLWSTRAEDNDCQLALLVSNNVSLAKYKRDSYSYRIPIKQIPCLMGSGIKLDNVVILVLFEQRINGSPGVRLPYYYISKINYN
jgi:hypothetical protein